MEYFVFVLIFMIVLIFSLIFLCGITDEAYRQECKRANLLQKKIDLLEDKFNE